MSNFLTLKMFLFWRIAIFVFAALGVRFLSLRGSDFFAGGIQHYLENPLFWSLGNFDGEHYLSIAARGYKPLQQAFFPIYPFLIRTFGFLTNMAPQYLILGGALISNASFLFAIVMLSKLLKIDYSGNVVFLTILSLLVFPTSFYFGMVYSESLYLLVSVLAFYCARQGKWAWAGILGVLASSTRVYGILLFPAFLIEAWIQKAKLKSILPIFLVPVGLLTYMFYQWHLVGDPLAFYRLQVLVGPQHQEGIVFLPQVFLRYLKMIFTTSLLNPIFQPILLEFFTGVFFVVISIYAYLKKVRYSYLFYLVAGFIMPTIQGSFSSVPRYVLVLFPAFLATGMLIEKLPKWTRFLLFLLLTIWLGVETALFIRGYWVA